MNLLFDRDALLSWQMPAAPISVNKPLLIVLMLLIAATNFARIHEKMPTENIAEREPNAAKRPKFYRILDKVLPKRNLEKSAICDESDFVQQRLLKEYGALFIISEAVVPPPVCIFTDAAAVEKFQTGIFKASAQIEDTYIELQTVAMAQYQKAREKAHRENLDITPRGGSESARRSFADTVRLWKSRFNPACEHWLKEGRLTAAQVADLKKLGLKEQVGAVLKLEEEGIYFNTFFNRSILYSVAAPGASQHLALLALDVAEFRDERVREILADYGWFRTVQNDAPHFTFLGHREKDLKKMGLKKIETDDGEFWIPDAD